MLFINKLLSAKIKLYKWAIPLPVLLWFLMAIIAVTAELLRYPASINNYFIFKGVFRHTLSQQNLYLSYPLEYNDTNHYGPAFSLLIAPFALLNNYLGCFLWCMANAFFLFYAVQQLPLAPQKKLIILLIGSLEMMTAIHSVQFNPMITAWIILSYTQIEKENEFWATFFLAAGILLKIYGIVGLAFFLFSKHKVKFIAYFIFWMAVLITLPMIIASPSFVLQSYKDWFDSLMAKNSQNEAVAPNNMQDISVQGMIKRVFALTNFNSIYVLATAALFYVLPFFRWQQFKELYFRLSYLAFCLIGVVIFSSSAESPTYVIALMGVAIWFVIQEPKNNIVYGLLILALLLTSLSATDLFPKYIRVNYIRPFALKALPCFLIWLYLAIQLLTKNFKPATTV